MQRFRYVFIVFAILGVIGTTAAGLSAGFGELRTQEEACAEVNACLEGYLPYDSQGKNRGIHATSNGMQMRDLNGNIIAYMLPLFDAGGAEVGYLITSAAKGSCYGRNGYRFHKSF